MSDYRTRIYERYATTFKGRTETFDREEASGWGRAYHHYLRDWLPAAKDARITDLACGHGNLLFFLSSLGYTELAGVDISPDQVRLARQVARNVEEGNLLDYLGRHAGEFDLVCGLDIIEHMAKDEVLEFLDGCFSALAPGGRLILQTPNAVSPFGNIVRYGDFTHEVCFEERVLGQLLELVGFDSPESREMGPVPWGYSLLSSVRFCLWRATRFGLRAINTIETGGPGPKVWTRVFLTSAVKPAS